MTTLDEQLIGEKCHKSLSFTRSTITKFPLEDTLKSALHYLPCLDELVAFLHFTGLVCSLTGSQRINIITAIASLEKLDPYRFLQHYNVLIFIQGYSAG